MADLSELQSAGTTKIVGANSVSGSEDYFAEVDIDGNLKTIDPTVGTIGSTAPLSAALSGAKNPAGNLVGLNADAAGQLKIKDSLNVAAPYGAISVSTTAIEAKVGASRLVNRKMIYITPTTGAVWFGSDSSVTILTGTKIFKDQTYPLPFTDNIPVFLISAIVAVDVRIMEGS